MIGGGSSKTARFNTDFAEKNISATEFHRAADIYVESTMKQKHDEILPTDFSFFPWNSVAEIFFSTKSVLILAYFDIQPQCSAITRITLSGRHAARPCWSWRSTSAESIGILNQRVMLGCTEEHISDDRYIVSNWRIRRSSVHHAIANRPHCECARHACIALRTMGAVL
jgi:hypothetical protein